MSQNFAFSAYAPRVSTSVAYTNTHSGATLIPAGTTRLAVKATTDAYILFGGSSVAVTGATDGWYLTGTLAEVFDIPPGVTHFDVIRVSANGSLFYTAVS